MATQENHNPLMGNDELCMKIGGLVVYVSERHKNITPEEIGQYLLRKIALVSGETGYRARYENMRTAMNDFLRRRGDEPVPSYCKDYDWLCQFSKHASINEEESAVTEKTLIAREGELTWRGIVANFPELPLSPEISIEIPDDDEAAADAAEAEQERADRKLGDAFINEQAAIKQREIAPDTNLSLLHFAHDIGVACTPPPPEPTDKNTREFVRKHMETDEDRERRDTAARERLLGKALDATITMMATLLGYQGVSPHLIASRVSDATRIQPSVVYEESRATMSAFLKKRGDEPARPSFYRADFSGMARFVHDRGLQDVEAVGPTDFRRGEYQIPLHIIDAIIHRTLQRCAIWNKGRDDLVFIDSRLVGEVRRALARMYPRIPTIAGGKSAPTLELVAAVEVEALAAPGAPTVARFADEMLIRAPGQRIASEAIYVAYIAWSGRLGTVPEDRRVFFRKLAAWGRGFLMQQRGPRASGREHGYVGVQLRAVV
jgi:hypothetical protein